DTLTLAAVAVAFIASLAMWWIYFDTSSKDGSHAIEHSADPGRLGAWFHYVHVLIVAGIIVAAVGSELVIAHPHGHVGGKELAVVPGGAALYLFGNALYRTVVYGRWPRSHAAAGVALAALAVVGGAVDLLVRAVLTTVVLVGVAVWDGCAGRR
ncbi:MAG: low temperature requirement protein A, partial [Rhizobacter sp.]